MSAIPIELFNRSLILDHCPGGDVNSPWVESIVRRSQAAALGYNLGPYDDAPAPEAEGLLILATARAAAKALRDG